MQLLGIKEQDLEEYYILGSGKGGQKLQKTRNCVYLKHKPTQIAVRCAKSRNREDNRFFARRELCDKMMVNMTDSFSKKEQLIEKKRKQKKRIKRRQQKKTPKGTPSI